ncbi:MAG TPA: HAMP domain-containing sensor histidine kinase [Anaeromyxobacter sp.]|nr:HAMP domain-containing sensor histidine kinase [Anaeromyxobacter sp.]
MPLPRPDSELRVLVVAPIGRDGELTCRVLAGAGIPALHCADLEQVARELAGGAGAILLTVDALGAAEAGRLDRLLQSQEPWSDVPVVLAADRGLGQSSDSPLARLELAGTLTVLERPIRVVTLLTVLRAALRARARQYELRDLLEQLRASVARLDTERVVRERFVALLAHDLRGPLSVISMSAQVMATRPQSVLDRPELALRVRAAAQRMERMIRDLLDANALRAGERLAITAVPCDLVEIVTEALSDLDEGGRRRVHASLPDRLEGAWAPDELRRAVWNLVTNGLKYGRGGAPVTVEAGPSGDRVRISVHNEGPPIPPEEQVRIFEPFGRGRGAATVAAGWGLGLTLVRGCAEAHGGELVLTSTPERGTTFTLWLPRDARSNGAA